MPKATVRANARTMPKTTNRRASKSKAGLTRAPRPRAARPIAHLEADERAVLLVGRWRETKQAWDLLASSPEGTEKACERAHDLIIANEHVLQGDLVEFGSMQTAGALLSIEIEDSEDGEIFRGFYRGMLRAIRPHLLGTIAEAADLALASPIANRAVHS